MLPPFIQTYKLHCTKVHPSITKVHLPFIQITLHLIKSHLPTRVLLPTVLMYSRAIDHPLLFIKSKLHYIKIPFRITKLHRQITKQTHILEAKLLVWMPEIISRCLPLSKTVMILPDQDFKKGLQGTLLYLLNTEPNCMRDWLRLDTSTLWGPSQWMLIQSYTSPIRDVLIITTMLDMIRKIVSTSSTKFRI